jgi:hypothetical protein
MKDSFDFRQVFVKIEMFRLDIQNQDMFGMKTTNGAVALVPFGHKKFTTRIPVRVLSRGSEFLRRRNGTGASPPSRKTCAVIAEVVVLPCMPPIMIPRFPCMIAASASARRAARVSDWRALTRIGLSGLIAEE